MNPTVPGQVPGGTPPGAGTQPTPPPGGFQNGAWYNGMQYWNGQLGAPNTIINPNQQGAGQQVSAETNKQSSVAQGKDPNAIANYLGQNPQGASPVNNPDGTPVNAPNINLQSIYDSAVTNNPEYIKAVKEMNDTTAAHDLAVKNANDNPFYSEGRRIGEQSKIDSEYNADSARIQNTIKQITDAGQTKLSLAQGQYSIDNQNYKDNISNLNSIISNGGLKNASDSDLSTYAAATGIPMSMLKSMAGNSKANDLQLTNATDSDGNLTVVAVDKNTGQIVNQQTVSGVGKAKTPSVKGNSTSKAQQVADANYAILNYTQDKKAQRAASPEDFMSLLIQNYPLAGLSLKNAQQIRKQTQQ